MKRIQPFYYIVVLAVLFVLAGLVLFTIEFFQTAESTGITVDPQTQEESETLYDLWFTSSGIYSLSVDHNLTGILLSTDTDSVSLLDRDRKLLWNKIFTTAPLHAKISSCGKYVLVGTSGGRLFFTSADQQAWWDNQGDPVDQIAFSPNASWVIAARSKPDEDFYYLDLYNQAGELQWSKETGPLKNLFFSSEYLDQANIYYTSMEDELPVINAVNLEGELIWSYEGQSLAAVSKHGSRLVAVQDSMLIVYDSLGYELWSIALPFEPATVIFNPQNYNRILVYGSREGALENLYYFDLAEDLLWTKRIADGSLFAFTAEGQHVVTSSWRHYKEDYTQMILLDRDGNELNSWEVAMRVERLIVSGHPHLIVVCGEDGYIDLIDLKPLLSDNGNGIPETPLYNPVITGQRADETRLTLYFIDDKSNLVPVTRLVAATENLLQTALEELIRGPARGSFLYRTIPDKEISIEVDFNSNNGRLVLDLSPDLVQLNGSAQSLAALNSLVMTVSTFPEVKEIYLTMNGEQIDSFGDELSINQPLKPHRWQKPVYVPIMSDSRYYLLIQEGTSEQLKENDLRLLLNEVILSFLSFPFVPPDLALIDLNITSEQTQLNMNRSFRDLFPEEAGNDERLKAALVLDALFLTVFENSRAQRVEILVNGERWTPPAGYPSINRFLRQPFFINPE